jgi:hypothetical protein
VSNIAEIKTETCVVKIYREEPVCDQDQGLSIRIYDHDEKDLLVFIHVMGSKKR